MSALSAIETPVGTAPAARSATGQQFGRRERSLRAIAMAVPDMSVQASGCAPADAKPRSSSIPEIACGLPSVARAGAPAAPPPASARAIRAPLRLTRRGRIVVAALVIAGVMLAVLLITLLVSGGAQATNHGPARAGYQGMHQVVVQPGQTLWSIAAAAEPSADPRTVIQEIMSANALASPAIGVGQLLWVP